LPPPRAAETRHAAATAPSPEIKRVTVGGLVKMAQVLHRVEPQYPPLARQARVSGVVELVGVISIDGHLKELRLVSGHPLLARAAMEAVSQWIYSPTTLNGEPVEVIAPITVTFRLN
ncbi:MAG: energy transducer TonB, partial [Acidobacteriia bacterium]|nr:energy transducer TonB [Terriglobia bacterium]